jgi:hypothetical protein
MARLVLAPRQGCELLEADQGAYANVLTLSTNEAECRTKVANAMNHYHFEVVEVEDIFLFSDSSNASEKLTAIAMNWRNREILNTFVLKRYTFSPGSCNQCSLRSQLSVVDSYF